MAYSSTNPVRTIDSGISDGMGLHIYRSTHAHAAVEGTGFFTDHKSWGLRLGDIVIAAAYSTAGSSAVTLHLVNASTGAVGTPGSSVANQAFNATVTPFTT
jgi:hypothetical protein